MKIKDNVIFKYGDNKYEALDATTGKRMYVNAKMGTWWAFIDGDYVYLQNRNGEVKILNLYSGKILETLVCPDYETKNVWWNGSIEPTVVDGKFYLMSYTSAYCYPAYPWKEQE